MDKSSPLLVVRVPLQGWSSSNTTMHAPLASAEDLSRHNSPCVRYALEPAIPNSTGAAAVEAERMNNPQDSEDGALLLPLANTQATVEDQPQPVDRHVFIFELYIMALYEV
jgi:hypothetical protein